MISQDVIKALRERITALEAGTGPISSEDFDALQTRIADLEGGNNVSQATFDALQQRVTALENADAAPPGERRLHASPDPPPHSYLPSTTQLNAVIYFNSEAFDAQNYGDPIKRTSKLTYQTLNNQRSSFDFKLQTSQIVDEITFFQLGESTEYQFYNPTQTDANSFNVSPLIKNHYPENQHVYFSTFLTYSSDLHTF